MEETQGVIMRIVVDSNIIFSAIVRDSITRRILLHPHFDFYTPEYALEEIERYKSLIAKKAGLSVREIDALLSLLFENIKAVKQDIYKSKIGEARKLIGKHDEKDIPYAALALSIPNSGIWTYDKHFFSQKTIRVWKTEELIELIG